MRISAVDGRAIGDEDVAACVIAYNESLAADFPGQRPIPHAEGVARYHHAAASQDHHVWVARDDDGEPLGYADLQVDHGETNNHMASLFVHVRPAARRRGAGTALAEAAARQADEIGRRVLITPLVEGTGNEAFAGALGGALGLVNHLNRLVTADVDRGMLEEWVATGEAVPGYSLVTWDGRCPDEYVESFCQAWASMNDAPVGDLDVEDEVLTPELLRDYEAADAEKGLVGWLACVRHDATGEIAALTELYPNPYRPWIAHQEDTCVVPAHRGHRFGRWVKAANLLRLLDERPEVDHVETWNAGTNEHMLAINHALGFRQVEAVAEYQAPTPVVLERVSRLRSSA